MTDQDREEFEAWATSEGYHISKNSDGDYNTVSTFLAAKVWQAARAQPAKPLTPILSDAQLTKVAHAWCKHMANECGVDAEDSWKWYFDEHMRDAKVMVELVEAALKGGAA